MQTRRFLKPLLMVVALALVAAACSSNGSGTTSSTGATTAGAGVKGGTLRIFNLADVDYLDTADAYYTVSWALIRTYARELYSWDINAQGSAINDPVPDLATSYTVNSNKTVWTFKIRPNVKWSPPVNRDVTAQDFVTAVERMYDRTTPSGGQSYSNLIVGASAFGAGKAKTISGMKVISPTELQITLTQPTADFLSIVALPFFAPVPAEYASKFKVGSAYSKHVAATGPYMLQSYVPGKSITIVRNPNWDAATDPLRKAWVNSIDVTEGYTQQTIQQSIQAGNADLNLDSEPPNVDLQNLSTSPTLSKQFSDPVTGCLRYLELETNPAAGPIGQGHKGLLIRQAINYALDKIAIQRARGGPLAGEPASTILPPTLNAFRPFNLYPSAGNHGDIARAKALLSAAGYPHGITLSYIGVSEGNGPAVDTAIQASLLRAGIHLTINEYTNSDHYTEQLEITSKRTTHEVGVAGWCPDYPGNGARSFIVPLLYGPSILPSGNSNYSEFNDPHENALIAAALKTPSISEQNILWGEADHYAMTQAVWAPFLYDRTPFFWGSRVHNWKFSPWVTAPDLTNIWLQPNTP